MDDVICAYCYTWVDTEFAILVGVDVDDRELYWCTICEDEQE